MKRLLGLLNDKFVELADLVSSAMGTPLNIIAWIIAVLAWILLFAYNPNLQNTNFLPAWFTSNSFNFPLNTVTTLAELYIGFLVAAAANRVERRNQGQMERIERLEEKLAGHLEEQDKHLEEQDVAIDELRGLLVRIALEQEHNEKTEI